ncbi:inositol monophosphatase family protein [Curtobacterium sp. PhB146]|uniref:inositol monophosphatase family protein n=1 Tax=Curtobacterium sp. PhB146 TaxID=2485187 RepID=UPI001404C911|nr:inositol monophosphatase family protein [Curtobacterium sp. PhB146]
MIDRRLRPEDDNGGRAEFCALIATRAGEMVDGFASPANVRHKNNTTELVSDLDVRVQKFLVNEIRRAFPGDSIMAEEQGFNLHGGPIKWCIDPLDGTSNYLAGKEDYAISVGVSSETRAFGASILKPRTGEYAHLLKGKVSSKLRAPIKRRNSDPPRIAVGVPYALDRSRHAYQLIGTLSNSFEVARSGSAACDLLRLVAGDLHVYISAGLPVWDTAAGRILVDALDGRVEQFTRGAAALTMFSTRSDAYVLARPILSAMEKL